MYHITTLLLLLCTLPAFNQADQGPYLTQNGRIFFRSDAPLEVIEAASEKLKGAIDPEKRTFAFTVDMESFKGFNNPLQQTHFYENYMETGRYPTAVFMGKIIENTDLSQDGEYTVRAKGSFIIHGVEQERIIKSEVRVENGELRLVSRFTVLLKEHDITIPRIVYQKIAEEIEVTVEATLARQVK